MQTEASSKTLGDANNNNEVATFTHQEPSSQDGNHHFTNDGQSIHGHNELKPDETESVMDESGNLDDWLILSPEEAQPEASKRSGNVSSINGAAAASKPHPEYLQFDPLGPRKFSPLMIHLCTAIYSLLPLASALAGLTLITLIFTRFYPLSLIYFGYVFYTRNTCNLGGNRVNLVYESKFWSLLAAYFPIRLRYTREFQLDSGKNYILNYHPHGISAFGAVTVFATNGLNFRDLFQGIRSRFMVHETSFVMPIMKETFSLRGDCSVNSKSIDFILGQEESRGNLLCLVGGGLAEADLSHARDLKIVVAQRKGFVKKALIHGAHLIPCIAFGENSVFHKVNFKPKSFLHRLESKWYQVFKFKHPIYYGRSLMSDKYRGVMPLKRPITVVMGNPIEVERDENPSQMAIDNLHSKYLSQLTSMYAANKDLCENFDVSLELV